MMILFFILLLCILLLSYFVFVFHTKQIKLEVENALYKQKQRDLEKERERERERDSRQESRTCPEYNPYPDFTPSLPFDMYQRDRAVLDDPLYPPYNRMSMEPYDTYRLIGYMVAEEANDDVWHLYGRKKNNSLSDFYVRSSDKNTDIKIPITDNMFMSRRDRLRDMDNLPEGIHIDHPIFPHNAYHIIENGRADLNSLYF